MSTLFPRALTVSRSTGSYVNGVWTSSAVSITVMGSAQPMSGREIQALEIGRKDIGKIKLYTDTPLVVSTEGQANSGDVVTWQGKLWEVISTADYQNDLIPHYKSIAEYKGLA